jgi:hypothetical protein
MKLLNKIANLKRYSEQLGVLLLLGLFGLNLSTSHANPYGGIDNAKDNIVVASRDPFWPVGYKPEQPQDKVDVARQQMLVGATGTTDWNIAMNQVVINGVSSRGGNEYIAVINNEVKAVGETVSMWFGGTQYTWQVESIAPPGSVKLRRISAQ